MAETVTNVVTRSMLERPVSRDEAVDTCNCSLDGAADTSNYSLELATRSDGSEKGPFLRYYLPGRHVVVSHEGHSS